MRFLFRFKSNSSDKKTNPYLRKYMLLIYTHQKTNRLKYIFKLIFSDILKCDYSITCDVSEYRGYEGPKINYSRQSMQENELFFLATNILFETGIKDQAISIFNFNQQKVFFSTSKNSILPFDPFATAFYIVSRYEEYLPTIRDNHLRFDAHQSLAYQHSFLHKPVVDIWAVQIMELISSKYPSCVFGKRKYKFISTVDIDNAFAYCEKGLLRTLGGYLNDLFKLNVAGIKERSRVLLKLQKDPYNTYNYQHLIQKKFRFKSIYFFLVAEYGLNDKNVPLTSKRFQSLIKSIADYADVGVHPGYNSFNNPEKIESEIQNLEKILKRDITKSRQHFLRLSMPETYRKLIEQDITDDYTMGFAQEPGFRAGTCTPFMFYDLDLDIETKLRLHPFQIMDATMRYYVKVDPENAMTAIKPIIDEVKKVNGTFISLWHNESLSENYIWNGWRKVYEEMIEYALE